MEQISETASVCPVCLKTIPAVRLRSGDEIYLQKSCPEHGRFRTVLWRGKPSFQEWYRVKKAEPPANVLTTKEKGCPFDCGPCPEHRRKSCCVLVEITRRCNLLCPFCFAASGTGAPPDPSLEHIRAQLRFLRQTAGDCNIQLSGGEPTVRDDLPEIVAAARAAGFTFIQLNTNGIRLAGEPAYAGALKEAGLDTVFLQFDGISEQIYTQLRGRPLLQVKREAIENCARRQLGVVLVPTLVPGVNTGEIGAILDFARQKMPAVRAVHFQPVSYFGRYPVPPADQDRITLPEVIMAIEQQSGGLFKATQFAPSGCENSLCSFHGDFLLEDDGSFTPLTQRECSCCEPKSEAGRTVLQKQLFIRNRWAAPGNASCCGVDDDPAGSSFDRILHRLQNRRLSISCMAFQDAENLDLERLRDCCLSVLSGHKLIPFCAYNVTDRQGRALYRGRDND